MAEFFFKYVDDETWCLTGYKGSDAHVTLPDLHGGRPVTVVNDDIFKGHAELESVVLPAHLRTLGGFVFDGCGQLKTVALPESLTEIWQYAFVRSGITEIEIPGSLKHIIPFVFKDCTRLTHVSIKPGVRKIFGRAFDGCISLKEVRLPADTEVSPEAFTGCGEVRIIRY